MMQDEKAPRAELRCRIWLAVVAPLALCPLSAADDSNHAFDAQQVYFSTRVSREFQDEFQAAWQTIPAPVWERLSRTGWQVCLAELVIDAVPELRGTHPRGWPRGATWDNADAVHFSRRQLLVFAEKRRNGKGKIVASHRLSRVVRHEVGHAWDAVLEPSGRLYSSTSEFQSAYNRDVKRMSDADRQALRYFVQHGAPGPQEAFAEAFAILLGGGSDLENADRFATAFAGVIKLVKRQLAHVR